MSMNIIEAEKYYNELLTKLHCKVTFGQRAPHKAILMLSIIDLIETGVLDNTFIPFIQEIESQFLNNWTRYIGHSDSFKPRSSLPFWHLSHEPFWKVKLKETCDISFEELAQARAYSHFGTMAKYVDGAYIDTDLFNLINYAPARAKLRVLLIKTYL